MADSPEVREPINNEGVDKQLISDLLDGYMPPADGDEPSPGANPPADEGQPAGEPKAGEEAKPEGEGEQKSEGDGGETPDPAVAPKLEVKTYEYRGRQYSVDQLVELGVLEDVLQTARQFPTIQTKYQQLLEQRREGQPTQQPQQQPQQPGFTPEQVAATYVPIAEKVAEAGYIEREAVEAFPRLCSALMQHRDLLYDVRQAVALIMQHGIQNEEVSQKAMFRNYMDTTCDRISGEGDHYAPIKDPQVRQGFYEYLATLSIPAKEVNEDFLKRQWIAYNSEAVLEAARSSAGDRKAQDVKSRRNAAGEGGGPRPAPKPKTEKTVDTDMLDSFLDGDKRFATGG
jgi:hypothetical protein